MIPDSDSRYLTIEDLESYNKDELALIRNEIFARHGYVFKDGEYKEYFFNKSWYVPDSNFKGDDYELNSVERFNVNLIKTIEEK